MDPKQILAIAGLIGVVAVIILKHELNRILTILDRIPSVEMQSKMEAAIDRVPSTQTFREWGEKLAALDTTRLNTHYKTVHDHATIITTHGFQLADHEKRLTVLESYEGPERRRRQREKQD